MINSTEISDRTLTITGENLLAYEEKRLQFLDVATGRESIRFEREVNWKDSRRITIDMGRVGQELETASRSKLRVRITSVGSTEEASNWSDEFILAHDSGDCGFIRPFPPTRPIRGVAGDNWADVIIGQPDFSQIARNEVVPYKLFKPGGVVVDRSSDPGRAYVWDSGNSRILGIDLAACYSAPGPCKAEIVIGQPSLFNHGACNGDSGFQLFPVRARSTAETLCGIPEWINSVQEDKSIVTMAVDELGTLYVPDSFNNRVLRYDNPFDTDSVADQVWGQTDFSGNLCNGGRSAPTAATLCFHSIYNRARHAFYGVGVELDPSGNLWVADGGNNRVLRFRKTLSMGKSRTPPISSWDSPISQPPPPEMKVTSFTLRLLLRWTPMAGSMWRMPSTTESSSSSPRFARECRPTPYLVTISAYQSQSKSTLMAEGSGLTIF